MAHIRKAEITSPITTLTSDSTVRLLPVFGLVGIGCLVGGYFLSGADYAQFAHRYLVAFCFLLSICLGGLFFVLVQHLTRAGWSVTVRRIAEIMACCLAPLFLLSLPILIPVVMGSTQLYSWNAGASSLDWSVGDKSINDLKTLYLNNTFFAGRVVVYFVLWTFMSWTLYRWSVRQDETGDVKLTQRMQAFSAPMMLLFAATIVFSSFDFEMSLAPMWFSTMFPVYFFAGAVMSGLATITLIALWLQRSGRVTDEITVEHYHDLAKLTFAFIFFWGYVAFSQFMLIWYANIPEETFWFRFRTEGWWLTVSIILLFGHLLVPFLGMMARSVRRNKVFLVGSSIYLLLMHYLDHYWIVMPQLGAAVYPAYDYGTTSTLSIVDPLCLVGMILFFLAAFSLIAGKNSLVCRRDPRLHEALNYDNP